MRDFDAERKTRLCRYPPSTASSDMDSPGSPSTAIQHANARLNGAELTGIGVAESSRPLTHRHRHIPRQRPRPHSSAFSPMSTPARKSRDRRQTPRHFVATTRRDHIPRQPPNLTSRPRVSYLAEKIGHDI